MMARPLMAVDELKTLPRFHFIVAKTGCNPMRTKLDLFFKWGIQLDDEYEVDRSEVRKVYYAGKDELIHEIEKREGKISNQHLAKYPGRANHIPEVLSPAENIRGGYLRVHDEKNR